MARSQAEEVNELTFVLWKMQNCQKVLRQVVVRFATWTVWAASWRMGLPETVKATGVGQVKGTVVLRWPVEEERPVRKSAGPVPPWDVRGEEGGGVELDAKGEVPSRAEIGSKGQSPVF